MLGMSLGQNDAEPHQYILGQSTINLWQVPTSQPAIVGMPNEMLGMSLLQLVIRDVLEARALIVSRGGAIHTEPYNVGDLAVVMFIEGPDGILIEFGAAL
jgi:predicted enzyme related to lactoylglutathione lyase